MGRVVVVVNGGSQKMVDSGYCDAVGRKWDEESCLLKVLGRKLIVSMG